MKNFLKNKFNFATMIIIILFFITEYVFFLINPKTCGNLKIPEMCSSFFTYIFSVTGAIFMMGFIIAIIFTNIFRFAIHLKNKNFKKLSKAIYIINSIFLISLTFGILTVFAIIPLIGVIYFYKKTYSN